MQPQQIKEKKSELFIYLLSLTAFFILIEISLFIQSNETYLGNFKLVSDRLSIPGKVIPGILYFFLIELFLHFIFTCIVWMAARLIADILSCTTKNTVKIGFSLWLLGIVTILLANQVYFPNSIFAELTKAILGLGLAKILLTVFAFIWSLIFLTSITRLILKAPKAILAFVGFALIVGLWNNHSRFFVMDAATKEKPNVILIGIDSLRPDFLGYFGYEKITPYFDNFLNEATVFSDALTPIARTFPSWMSILTGQYPKHNGVRYNLPSLSVANWQETLPSILQKNGYETIFATDETRFSNIDEKFGFNKIVTPPIGVNDFLLGTLNDFPFSNLLVNTWVGKYLFPFSYGNRPAIATYNPNTFLNLLAPTLAQSRNKPLFLSIHFCLPHFPYVWGGQKLNSKSINNYRASVQRVDQQFHDFLLLLQKNNLLNHTVLILLSDHGEAIELSGDRLTESALFIPGKNNNKKVIPHFYPPSVDLEAVNKSAGHGTDILSMSQYHTVLAFKLIGLEKNQIKAIPNKISLLDIKPTLLEFLNISPSSLNDGQSLISFILDKKKFSYKEKDFFMETDFSPQAIRTAHPETRKLLFEGINFFQVDPNTARITVKESMGQLIISSKQFADIKGEWILALYPQNKTKMMPILVNLNTGQWTNDLRTAFAIASPAQHMLIALKNFYGKDLSSIDTA